jgi:hypothetical protein
MRQLDSLVSFPTAVLSDVLSDLQLADASISTAQTHARRARQVIL